MKSDGEHITKHAALLTSYLSEHLKAARLVEVLVQTAVQLARRGQGHPHPSNCTQCRCSPWNGATSTDSFELTPPSVADMFVMNMSRPLKTALALKSSALLPVPL